MSNQNLPVRNVATLNEFFDAQTDTIAALLPAGMDIQFLRANVLAAVSANPKLLDCTRSSLYQAIFEVGELGLMAHSVLGEAWILPYGNKAQLVVGYQGKVKLLYNTGLVKLVESRVRFSNDIWECEYGLNPKLRLVEAEGHRGTFMGAYCKIELMTGGTVFEYYPDEKIQLVREKSSSYKYFKKTGRGGDIWGDEHNKLEMDRKTVLNNLSKWVPRTGKRYAMAMEIDHRDYNGYYDQDHDAEERLYKAVGVIEAPKDDESYKGASNSGAMIDEFEYLFGSGIPSDEVFELCKLVTEKEPGSEFEHLTSGDRKQIIISIQRAKKFLIGKTISADEGQDRVLRFFRFCMLNQFLLNTTRNLDAARSAFVEDEKSN